VAKAALLDVDGTLIGSNYQHPRRDHGRRHEVGRRGSGKGIDTFCVMSADGRGRSS
jgi:hypothetical protein